MLRLDAIKGAEGSTHSRKRLGRGVGSGLGKTSGKGHKGLTARKGGGRRIGYEGGQMPLFRRIPKRGFHNFTRKEYAILNLGDLENLGMPEVSLENMQKNGMVPKSIKLLKILANGELKKSVQVKAHKFSAIAKEKIEKAGGTIEVLDVRG